MKYIPLFILSLVFWMLLTFKFTIPNLAAGSVVSLACSLIFTRYYMKNTFKFLQPHRYFWFIVYLFVFIWECIKANLDVAYRVLHPAMPIRPGIVKVKTTLKSDMARALLANSITMTPGTISLDIIGDYLYIHWIYVRSDDPEVYTNMITGAFEKYIKKIVE
ncbi:MAG TPA: Na+/H+ antiporter subunit E [Bacteroidales bacterium]|jgi:multicomponent Na+:H+ antiporter subunit E|nr:Na+/H+ antiporter subunit E [Bacteroidales bacterium]